MHDTHQVMFSHRVPVPRRLKSRLRLLDILYARWAITGIFCLSVQFATGLSTATAVDLAESSGRLQLTYNGASSDAIQLDAHMEVNVTGLLAEMTLTQTFTNTTDQWVAGSYLFPLDGKATLQGLVIRVGERVINGRIMPRLQAQQTYDTAQQAGQIASLIEQQRPNLFTAKVANIAPGDHITVVLSVMIPVTVDQQSMQLRLPTTLTPRYTNDISTDPEAVHSPFITSAMSRGPRLDVSINVDGQIEALNTVESSTHRFTRTDSTLEIEDIAMDQDIVIQWPFVLSDSTTGKAFVSQFDGERYVQILLTPKTLDQGAPPLARELILVIDKSGSMAGVSIEAAREALHFALDGLSTRDSFNLVAFDDQMHSLFESSKPVTEQSLKVARRFIDRLDADGGTEMQAALNFALKKSAGRVDVKPVTRTDAVIEQPVVDQHRLKQVVFMTDGSVGYEDELLSSIKRHLGNSRLFTVGIGPAPNGWFLEKAAEVGRGISLNIQHAHDVSDTVTRLLSTLASPVLTDITVQFPLGHGETYPTPIPDLYAGKPGMWVSRISSHVSQIIVTGKQQGRRWTTTLSLTDTTSASSNAPAVAMHWARSKIDSWLDEQRYSADPELHKSAIVDLALSAGLVTRYTSFIAVEEQSSRPGESAQGHYHVANLIPAGNTMMSVPMPQGAAGADTLSVISLLLGICGIATVTLSRCQIFNRTGSAA